MDKTQITRALRNVIDPELGVSVYDLGLIYDINISANKAHILVTLTSMACPMANHILSEIEDAVVSCGFKRENVDVELTFDPPWNQDLMSDDAKAVLGIT